MTTLFDLTRRVARQITDVLTGAATAGAATSLTDTDNLLQSNGYWDRGTLWIHSGTHADKAVPVTGFASNKLSFDSLGSAIAAGVRYSVARHVFPYRQLVAGVRQALDEIKVITRDSSLLGDGTTLEFVLPVGVSNIVRVELEHPYIPENSTPSNHYKEFDGTLKFDYGFAPCELEVIHVYYKKDHDEIVDYDDEIDPSVNVDWLKWKAAEHVLYWGVQTYGDSKEFRIEEMMNKVISRQKGILPSNLPIEFRVRTAGG